MATKVEAIAAKKPIKAHVVAASEIYQLVLVAVAKNGRLRVAVSVRAARLRCQLGGGRYQQAHVKPVQINFSNLLSVQGAQLVS